MAGKRRFETRTYVRADKAEREYKVYYIEGRDTPAIEEAEIVALAIWAGCKDFIVSKPIQAVQDNMFYASYLVKKAEKEGEFIPKTSMRYIAYYSVTGPDGNYYEEMGSAGADNIQMSTMKSYAPELASKRARVRACILALNMKGLNADIEFPDGDSGDHSSKDLAKDNVEETATFIKDMQTAFEKAKIPVKQRADFVRKTIPDKEHPSLFTKEEQAKLLEAINNYGG